MCFISIITVVHINLCLIASPKSQEIMFRAKMFHRNSDSMNKSNFDTISHPLLPLPALPKILKRRKQFRKQSKANKRLTLKVFDIVWNEWRNANCNLLRNRLRFSDFMKLTSSQRMNGEGGNFDAFEARQCKSDNLIRIWSLPMYKRVPLEMPSWCFEIETLFHKLYLVLSIAMHCKL